MGCMGWLLIKTPRLKAVHLGKDTSCNLVEALIAHKAAKHARRTTDQSLQAPGESLLCQTRQEPTKTSLLV